MALVNHFDCWDPYLTNRVKTDIRSYLQNVTNLPNPENVRELVQQMLRTQRAVGDFSVSVSEGDSRTLNVDVEIKPVADRVEFIFPYYP